MRTAAALLVAASSWLPTPAEAEDKPRVRLGATYVTDVLTVVDGGDRRGTAWLGRADVTASIERPLGIEDAELFVDVMRVNGPDFSGPYVGDAQTVSNVQADSALRPYEAWIAFPVATGLTAKAGLIDLNTEFDVQEIGRLFLNSSFGIGPDFSQTGQNGPSIFPAPATAAMLRYEASGWALRLGIFDAVAGSLANPRRTVFRLPGARGALLVGEVERQIDGVGVLQLGLWHYTTRFDSIDPDIDGKQVSRGAYALVERQVAALGTSTLRASTLWAWGRIGIASGRANPIGLYLGGGVAWRSGKGETGLAVAHARLGDPARRAARAGGSLADRAETAIELTYARLLIPGVTIQPDLQYVINPGWLPMRRDALVAGVRFSFAWPAE